MQAFQSITVADIPQQSDRYALQVRVLSCSAEKSSDKGVVKLAGEDNLIKVFERGTKAYWSDSELKKLHTTA